MRVARRLAEAGESATLAVQQAAATMRAKGADVVDFGLGEPDFPTPKSAIDGALVALDQGFTRYTATAGIPELRDAIAGRYAAQHGAVFTRENVVVTAGAKQALYNAFMALLDEGDEAIVPAPCWVSYPDQIRLAGAVPKFVWAGPERGFVHDAAAIEAAVTPRTRAIVLNSPCNPTGAVLTRGALGALVEVARRHDLAVIYDETYEHFVYGAGCHVSAAAFARELGPRLLVVNSFSKTYAMTGMRLGYLLGPPDLLRAVATFQSHTTSNASSVGQKAALAALGGSQEAVAKMLAEYRVRRAMVIEGLAGVPGVELEPPGGAFYAFPCIEGALGRLGIGGSAAFAEWLLQSAHVATVPGAAFEAEGFLRLSFATATSRVAEGLRRIRRALGA